jgi:predicted aldo/keto reductase-like oxidoreductase
MRLPLTDSDQSHIDMKKSEALLMRAYELGVNYYDSAFFYHNGKSESALGEILASNGIRSKVNIATKFPMFGGLSGGGFEETFKEQLARLKTDHIDFYLLHGLRGESWDGAVEKGMPRFLKKLKEDGAIRYYGFSFHDSQDAFKHIIDGFDWDFCQIQYNFIDQDIQAGNVGLEYAEAHGVKTVVMEPLKGGQLSSISGAEVDGMREKHGLSKKSVAQISLGFVLNRPEILTALSGMNEISQLEENAQAASEIEAGGQPESEKAFLAELGEWINAKDTIGCTSCRYCTQECPNDVSIPQIFSIYNDAVRFNSKEVSVRNMSRFPINLECVECEKCLEVCPQHIDIPRLITKAKNYLGV